MHKKGCKAQAKLIEAAKARNSAEEEVSEPQVGSKQNVNTSQQVDWKDGNEIGNVREKISDMHLMGDSLLAVCRLRGHIDRFEALDLDLGEKLEELRDLEEVILSENGVVFFSDAVGVVEEPRPSISMTCCNSFIVARDEVPKDTLILHERPKTPWLSHGYQDGDVLQAGVAFVRAVTTAHEGDIQEAIQGTAFLFPNNIEDVPDFDLDEFTASWMGGWTSIDGPLVVEELSRYGDFESSILLLMRYLFNSFPSTGILVFGSKINHSCEPNLMVEVTEPDSDGMVSLRFVTNRLVQEGEPLTISYLQWHEAEGVALGRMQRQKQLRGRWAFDCQCALCQRDVEQGAGLLDAGHYTKHPEAHTGLLGD